MPSSSKPPRRILQAARIKQPLLLAHGGADLRVPLVHALLSGRQAEQSRGGMGGISGRRPRLGTAGHALDFWSRVEKFLDKHIGKH
jgi:hypothetical protein